MNYLILLLGSFLVIENELNFVEACSGYLPKLMLRPKVEEYYEQQTRNSRCPTENGKFVQCTKAVIAKKTKEFMESYWETVFGCCKNYEEIKPGVCTPICANCGNGTCTAPDLCICNPGFKKNGNKCVPICESVCVPATCDSTPECECPVGYTAHNDIPQQCEPICREKCENGFCSAPETCTCNEGYKETTKSNQCKPVCDKECINADCTAPNICTCIKGYAMRTFSISECSTRCGIECTNGKCDVSGVCVCNAGFENKPDSLYECVPKCNKECINGYCTNLGLCKCNEGHDFKPGSETVCEELLNFHKGKCTINCGPGICSSENKCNCFDGYIFDNIENTCVAITNITQNKCMINCGNGRCIPPDKCQCSPEYEFDSKLKTCIYRMEAHKPQTDPISESTVKIPETTTVFSDNINTFGVSKPDTDNVLNNECIINCGSGVCVPPDYCECPTGYTFDFDNTSNSLQQTISKTCIIERKEDITERNILGNNMNLYNNKHSTANDAYTTKTNDFITSENYENINAKMIECTVNCGPGICRPPNQCDCPPEYNFDSNENTCVKIRNSFTSSDMDTYQTDTLGANEDEIKETTARSYNSAKVTQRSFTSSDITESTNILDGTDATEQTEPSYFITETTQMSIISQGLDMNMEAWGINDYQLTEGDEDIFYSNETFSNSTIFSDVDNSTETGYLSDNTTEATTENINNGNTSFECNVVCGNGTCIPPDKCDCWDGFLYDNQNMTCIIDTKYITNSVYNSNIHVYCGIGLIILVAIVVTSILISKAYKKRLSGKYYTNEVYKNPVYTGYD